jgi:hypothetical protein
VQEHFGRDGYFLLDDVTDGVIQGLGVGPYAPVSAVND